MCTSKLHKHEIARWSYCLGTTACTVRSVGVVWRQGAVQRFVQGLLAEALGEDCCRLSEAVGATIVLAAALRDCRAVVKV